MSRILLPVLTVVMAVQGSCALASLDFSHRMDPMKDDSAPVVIVDENSRGGLQLFCKLFPKSALCKK